MASHPYLDTKGPIAIAHRGGAAEAPENTIEAFRASYELGFRYLETDAQLTVDGTVVAFHDSRLDRVSGCVGRISDWTWEDLREVPIGGDSQIGGRGRLSTVAELLATFPNCRFNLDAKSDEVLIPLLHVVEEANAFERVCLGSFSDRRLRRARRLYNDRICTSLGPLAIMNLLGRSRGIRRPFGHGHAVQAPLSFRGLRVITQRFVDTAHDEGLAVHAWTIDDTAQMHHLFDLGVDGIMTDQPTVLRQVMEERGLW